MRLFALAALAAIYVAAPALAASPSGASDPVACAYAQTPPALRATMVGETNAAGEKPGVLAALGAQPLAPADLPLDEIAAACGLARDDVTDALVARGVALRAVEGAAAAKLVSYGAPADAISRAVARMAPARVAGLAPRLAKAGVLDVTREEDRAIGDGVRRTRVLDKPVQLPHAVRGMLAQIAQKGVAACLNAPAPERAACAG